jgi:hypothetical protein
MRTHLPGALHEVRSAARFPLTPEMYGYFLYNQSSKRGGG